MTADQRITLIRTKIERAKKHFRDLEAARNRFINPYPDVITSDPDPDTGDSVFKVVNIRTPPDKLGLIAGDVIHNLRSALDHLAYQLVLVNGREPTIRTGYPIFKTAKSYETDKAGKVKGMSDAAIHAIDATEPYGGGTDELYRLHTLDITDKHHGLIVTLFNISGVGLMLQRGYRPRFKLYNIRTPLKEGDIILT